MANTQYQQTSNVNTSVLNKGMVKNLSSMYMDDGMWTNAINAVNSAHDGKIGGLGNEESNRACSNAPYTIIGTAYKKDPEIVLFSTDGYSSEIGIYNYQTCIYTSKINAKCLNFDKLHLITGAVKQNYDKTYSVYWQDNKNVDRVLNLDDIPYILTEEPSCANPNPTPTANLDCDKIRLNSLMKQPKITVDKAKGSGQLNNGSYMACIAYSENGIRLTDLSIPSNPQSLWSHNGIGGGLEIKVEGLDDDFEEYELIVISIVNQQTIAKSVGFYSVNQTTVILDIINASLATVHLSIIPLRKMIYNKSEKMFAVNDYLIRTGVTANPLLNYQPQANNIKVEWRVEQVAEDYYKTGNKVSYLRDEVYSFFIRWIYDTGAKTHSYHIPGREASSSELATATNTTDIIDSSHDKVWQVNDTSSWSYGISPVKYKGKMGYWQSTERYPENHEIWEDLCGLNIRHHKMPSNETVKIHEDGKINILGVHFKNITHPKDSSGAKITSIIGYEILRGSREGNKSIIAKGMFNNMKAAPTANSTDILYQNYPYNDLRPDNFMVQNPSLISAGAAESHSESDSNDALNTIAGTDAMRRKDYFSFHSPETTFIKPYLSNDAHVKIYSEEQADVKGKFKFPYKHPNQLLLTDAAFVMAVIGGLGIGLTQALGRTTTEGGFEVGLIFGVDQHASRGDAKGVAGVVDKISAGIPNLVGLPGLIFGTIEYIANFLYYTGAGADAIADTIRAMMSSRSYALQYDSIGEYNKTNPVVGQGSYRFFSRAIKRLSYVGTGVQSFNSAFTVNNLNRNKYVLIQLEHGKTIPPSISSHVDNTRQRVRDIAKGRGGLNSTSAKEFYKNPTTEEISTKSFAYYGALKYHFDNQYGQIASIIQMPIGASYYDLDITAVDYNTGATIFGGDIYINRYTEKNPYMFFNEWMFDLPDMTVFNYRNYINGPLPRYWMDSNKFDISDYGLHLNLPNSGGLSAMSSDTDADDSENEDAQDGAFSALTNVKNYNQSTMSVIKPSSFHRLDRRHQVSGFMAVKHAYFYLSYNGIRDFYCESELNMAHRDYGEPRKDRFYDVYNHSFNDIQYMFRSDNITNKILHKYDLSLSASKIFNNFSSWGKVLPRYYDEESFERNKVYEYYPDRAVYSLKQVSGLKRDNWLNYLPLNYKDFGGHITSIKSLNATGNVILFDNKEPLTFIGIDRINTEGGIKLTVGDAKLFDDNNLKEMVNADDELNYGICESSRSAINTPYGLFWMSKGKIIQYQGQLAEISKAGMKNWFSENMQFKMLNVAQDYPLIDNVVSGIGGQAVYDPTLEIVYFSKKDYIYLKDNIDKVNFDSVDGVPYINTNGSYRDRKEVGDYDSSNCNDGLHSNLSVVSAGQIITLTCNGTNEVAATQRLSTLNGNILMELDSGSAFTYQYHMTHATVFVYETFYKGVNKLSECRIAVDVIIEGRQPIPYDNKEYWENVSWTVSYDPAKKQWVSFHDWIPDLTLSTSNHFISTKNNGLWKHNDSFESYCNFYGVDYPFEIDIPLLSKGGVSILRSLEYYLDVFKYNPNGIDYRHVLDDNFDKAIIYNSEQVSGVLSLNLRGKNSPRANLLYPQITSTGINILYSKEEQKYKFNQFWDITNRRGEFDTTDESIWESDNDGVHRNINSLYVDYHKSAKERKKFRHLSNNVILRKMVSGSKKFILKLVNAKQLISSR